MLNSLFNWYSNWLSRQPQNLHEVIQGVTVAICCALGVGALRLSTFAWGKLLKWRRKIADKRQPPLLSQAPARPRLGLAEALVAEEVAIAGLLASGNTVGELMGEIKKQRRKTDKRASELSEALRGGDRNTKVKFNLAVEAFAAEVNHAIDEAEPEAKAMTRHVASLHETQTVLYGERPPEAWINQLNYYRELRALSNATTRVYNLVDDTQYRGYRNDLDAALDRRLELRRDVASAWQEFAALLTKRIEAVERSRR